MAVLVYIPTPFRDLTGGLGHVQADGAGEVAARELLLHDQAGQGDQVADAESDSTQPV